MSRIRAGLMNIQTNNELTHEEIQILLDACDEIERLERLVGLYKKALNDMPFVTISCNREAFKELLGQIAKEEQHG